MDVKSGLEFLWVLNYVRINCGGQQIARVADEMSINSMALCQCGAQQQRWLHLRQHLGSASLKCRRWYTKVQLESGQGQTSMRDVGMATFLHQWQL